MTGNEDVITAKNTSFFNDNDRYLQSVSKLATYVNIRNELATRLAGTRRLLDIGNGGVFDYPLEVAEEIVGVDLFVGAEASARLPENVTLVKADARTLPAELGKFDTVAMVMLIHHLVGRNTSDQAVLIREMLHGARNAMTEDARLVIVESTVGNGFYSFEKRIYPLAYRWLTRRAGGHPPVLQPIAVAHFPDGRLMIREMEHIQHRNPNGIAVNGIIVRMASATSRQSDSST